MAPVTKFILVVTKVAALRDNPRLFHRWRRKLRGGAELNAVPRSFPTRQHGAMALRLSVPGLVGSQSQFLPTKSATGLGCAWRAAAGARSKRWSGPLKAPAAFTSRRAAIVAASASGAIAVDCLPTIGEKEHVE